MKKIKTRFAPSPTGHLHIGGLRTALFSYLYAKANDGEFHLRIEDTDMERNSQEAALAILDSFSWLGIHSDGEILYQSQRFDIYKAYVQKLLEEGKAYYCYMSAEELESQREEAKVEHEDTPSKKRKSTFRYDNRYRDFTGKPPAGIKPSVRLKTPLEGTIEFDDAIKGKMVFQAHDIEDFIIARSDGLPVYNFVAVVDDALTGITDVIRGDDHLTNTPKQILLYQALGFEVPRFCHLPMILGEDGKKLSKRNGAKGVIEYKAEGFLPPALLNYLVRLGWGHGDEEIFSLRDMLEKFTLQGLNTAPSMHNPSKLLWLNHHYIKEASSSTLEEYLQDLEASNEARQNLAAHLTPAQKEVLYAQLKDRAQTLVELTTQSAEILLSPREYDEKMLAKCDENAQKLLRGFCEFAADKPCERLEDAQALLQDFATSQSIKAGALMPHLRLALLGKSGGIGVAETLFILTPKEAQSRILELLAAIG